MRGIERREVVGEIADQRHCIGGAEQRRGGTHQHRARPEAFDLKPKHGEFFGARRDAVGGDFIEFDDLRQQQRLARRRAAGERALHALHHQPFVRGVLIVLAIILTCVFTLALWQFYPRTAFGSTMTPRAVLIVMNEKRQTSEAKVIWKSEGKDLAVLETQTALAGLRVKFSARAELRDDCLAARGEEVVSDIVNLSIP